MRFYFLILGALAVWRITHLLHAEDGPWRLLARFRERLGSGFWSELFGCFYCLSLWIAAPLAWALGGDWGERLLLWPALSGAAILAERATGDEPPALFYDDESSDPEPTDDQTPTPEGNDHVLRT
jgi:hypothetical protein